MGPVAAIIAGVVAAAASAAGGMMQASAAKKAAKQQAAAAREAAAERKEASAVQTATQRLQDRENRRQAIREERVKRARLLQSSENTGVGGSSGALGAAGALNTSLGQAVAFGRGQESGAMGIGAANQRAIDADTRGRMAQARGQARVAQIGAFTGAISSFASIFR